METPQENKKMIWTGRIISFLLGPFFGMSAVMKLLQHPKVLEGVTHMGLPANLIVPLGILELACILIYLLPPTAVFGAVLLTGYMGGAILTHLRIGEPVITHIGIGILIWLGIWLRFPHLRQLLPVVRR